MGAPADGLAVRSNQREFGISAQRAEQNLEVQGRGAGIVRQLRAEQDGRFAGVWFDNETGQFVVPMLPGASKASVEASLSHAHLGGDFRTEPAKYSWGELEAAHERIDEALAGLIEDGLVQTSLDPRSNSVIIDQAEEIGKGQRADLHRLAMSQPVSVELRPQPVGRFEAQADACKWYSTAVRVCDKPLRGGVFIEPSNESAWCTAGFKATGNTYGNRFMLTAGHCYVEAGAHWRSRDSGNVAHYVGMGEGASFPGNDWVAIRVNGKTAEGDEDWWEKELSYWPSEVAYWSGSAEEDIGTVYESSSYMGQTVCHSGATTGSSCGTVSALDKTVSYPYQGNVYHLTEASGGGLCAEGGDSGGPVFAGVTALGLLSGSHKEVCGGNVMYYIEITEADAALGVTVGTPAGAQPYATTSAATGVQGHQATGNGTVDPNGLATEYHFAYGTTTEYGSSTQNWSAGSGWGPGAVGGTISSLLANTTYHYRTVATNTSGYSLGADQQFTTPPVPPVVSTGPAKYIGSEKATLTGTVNPQGSTTSYYFEYGKTAAYGLKTASTGAGAGQGNVEAGRILSGLEPFALYHFRIVASNSAGTSYGGDEVFSPGWAVQTGAIPSGAIETRLEDVSCTSSTACTAVGYYVSKAGARLSVAERWNGTNWQVQTTPNPEGSEVTLRGVSCTSSSSCVAVGYYRDKSNVWKTLAEHWDGSEWKVKSTPNPTETGTYFFLEDVSCTSSSACTAVGHYFAVGGGVEYTWTLAERWNGTSWQVQYTQNHTKQNYLSGVSCTSSSACTAVGYYESSAGVWTASAQKWNGTSWSNTFPSTPGGGKKTYLYSVSCYSSSACTATGQFENGSGEWLTLAERWNGSTWAVQTTQNLEGGTQSQLTGVSCATSSYCMATGTYFKGVERFLAEDWDSTKWDVEAPANPEGAIRTFLDGVSCTSPTACMAVGTYENSSHVFVPLTEWAHANPPAATTGTATAVEATKATLNGSVDPEGISTTIRFEYGTTASYGSLTTSENIGEGSESVEVSKPTASTLTPETTYHFRVRAENWEGVTYGKDQTFTTPVLPPAFSFSAGEEGSLSGQLQGPADLAIDPEGNVWVADTGNDRIEAFDSEGEYLTQFGTSGEGSGQLDSPEGIAIDPEGNVWVADTGNDRIEAFSPTGEYLTQFGENGVEEGQLNAPADLAVDSGGNVWVANAGNDLIERFSPEGEYLGSQFAEVGQLDSPEAMAVDSGGNVWVAAAGGDRVKKYSGAGQYLSEFGASGSANGQLDDPQGIALTAKGNVWVADAGNSRIEAFNPKGEYQAKFGEKGSGSSQLLNAAGLAVDSEGNLWVADTGNDRIDKWAYGGKPTATTEAATEVSKAAALLNATVNPKAFKTTYQFEYGLTASYGTLLPASPQPVGSGGKSVAVSQAAKGLKAGTTYHFRVRATNSQGTSYGVDRTFKTLIPTPSLVLSFGENGSGPGQLLEPRGLTVDSEGNVWVADAANSRIEKFDSKGKYLAQLGEEGYEPGQFSGPFDVDVDSGGNVWVADTYNLRIQKLSPEGEYLAGFEQPGSGEGELEFPWGIATDSEGNAWVTDTYDCRVGKLNSEAEFIGEVAKSCSGETPFSFPTGIDVGPNGHVWVANYGKIVELNQKGEVVAVIGEPGSGEGQIDYAEDVAVDSEGNVWVDDGGNARIVEFDSKGKYVTAFREGKWAGGLAVDSEGNLWVTNPELGRVEEWAYGE